MSQRQMLLCLFGVFAWVAMQPVVVAQDALVNGGFVTGAIDLAEVDSYTFSADFGKTVMLRLALLSDNGVVPRLVVYAPGGAVVKEVVGAHTADTILNISTNGTYTVAISDNTGSHTANYNLYYTRPPGANEHGTLPNGGMVSGTIDLADMDSYTFDANVHDTVVLSLGEPRDTSLNPTMFVFSPSGALIAAPQSGALRFQAATGMHTVVVCDYFGEATGGYELYFARAPGANELGALSNGAPWSSWQRHRVYRIPSVYMHRFPAAAPTHGHSAYRSATAGSLSTLLPIRRHWRRHNPAGRRHALPRHPASRQMSGAGARVTHCAATSSRRRQLTHVAR